MVRNASFLSSKEVWQYITDLKISKVSLTVEDIEMILDTLVYDGKVERSMVTEGSFGEQLKTYRAVEKLLDSAGIVRIPCGVCPVMLLLSQRSIFNDAFNWMISVTGYSKMWYHWFGPTKELCLL